MSICVCVIYVSSGVLAEGYITNNIEKNKMKKLVETCVWRTNVFIYLFIFLNLPCMLNGRRPLVLPVKLCRQKKNSLGIWWYR